MTTASDARAAYRAAAERHGATVAELERTARRVEIARLSTFLVGGIAGLLRSDLPVAPAIPTVIALVFLVAFVVLVVRHRRLKKLLRRERAALTLARVGELRLDRDWAGLRGALDEFGYRDRLLEPGAAGDEAHPYAQDLDIFGPESVRALLGPTPSATGTETLGRWLGAGASVEEVRRRQGAVRALAADPEGRDALAIEGLLVDRVGRSEWRAFEVWLSSPLELPPGARVASFVLPPISAVVFVAWVAGPLSWVAWAAVLSVQAALSYRWGRALSPWFEAASARSPGVRRHHPLFAAWEAYDAEEPHLEALRARLGSADGSRASDEIRALERWLDAAQSRGSLSHAGAAAAFSWDIHVAAGLERWRRRAGPRVADWFGALGELEALSALATLAHDHPDWCFPELRDGVPGLEAEGLGHPLLHDEERRASDARVDPPGRFLLVTGSNMSGKSTFLRSIGLAAVLGQTGSVVCARRCVMTPLRPFTSMRIHDSLTGGVSLFMAELLRLKALVDAADRVDEPALLYLIDEVLQGTNSEERRVAARRILSHLLDANAIGAVTTHDLALHEEPRLDAASTKVHFRETVGEEGDQVLTFDYVLRPGLATSRNALKLLRIVGLGDGDTS